MEGEFIKFGKNLVPKEEILCHGYKTCYGCGLALSIRLSLKVLGKDTVVTVPPSCWASTISIYPEAWWRICWIHCLFEATASTASGIEAGYRILMEKGRLARRDIKSVGIAGDGGTADIGFQALSGALERGHDLLYICVDNEAYMNTGVQRSSLTPYGATTTNTPIGKAGIGQITQKKNMPFIVEAHNIPYVATATPGYPFDLMNKVRKAREIKGPTYIHILTGCPTGWKYPPNLTIEITKLAVQTGVFPLYEVENGHYKLNIDPPKLKPVEDYLKVQGRYRHLSSEERGKIQQKVDEEYAKLKSKVACFSSV
jgi:pyruvate ferredoxin oxidoreductase beta subunit